MSSFLSAHACTAVLWATCQYQHADMLTKSMLTFWFLAGILLTFVTTLTIAHPPQRSSHTAVIFMLALYFLPWTKHSQHFIPVCDYRGHASIPEAKGAWRVTQQHRHQHMSPFLQTSIWLCYYLNCQLKGGTPMPPLSVFIHFIQNGENNSATFHPWPGSVKANVVC